MVLLNNRLISVITIENRKIIYWRDYRKEQGQGQSESSRHAVGRYQRADRGEISGLFLYLQARSFESSDRTRTTGPGEGTPQALGIAKNSVFIEKSGAPERLELPTLWFEVVRSTLPNLARGVANRMDSASWGKFPQTAFPFFCRHLPRDCRCFPRFA